MPTLSTAGATLAYRIDGDGPWLTLLHGFSQDLTVWDAQVARLAGTFRVLRFDLRGHGGSRAMSGGYGPAEHLADLVALLDGLGIAATHLWGTHTGAGVGLLLAAARPERLGFLALEGPVIPGRPLAPVDAWQARAAEIARREGVVAATRVWFDEAPFFAAIRADPIARRAEAQRAIVERFPGAAWLSDAAPAPVPDLSAGLASIRTRTLIVNGSDDLPEFHDIAALLERGLPNARRVLVPGAGPFPAWEAPDAVTPFVAAFFEEAP